MSARPARGAGETRTASPEHGARPLTGAWPPAALCRNSLCPHHPSNAPPCLETALPTGGGGVTRGDAAGRVTSPRAACRAHASEAGGETSGRALATTAPAPCAPLGDRRGGPPVLLALTPWVTDADLGPRSRPPVCGVASGCRGDGHVIRMSVSCEERAGRETQATRNRRPRS